MAAVGLVHGIYCEKTKCIDGKLVDIAHNLFTLHKIFGPYLRCEFEVCAHRKEML